MYKRQTQHGPEFRNHVKAALPTETQEGRINFDWMLWMIMAVRTWLREVAAAYRNHSTDSDFSPRDIEIAGFHALLELLPADSETCDALLNGGLKDPVVQEVIRAANTNLDTGESGCPTCTDSNARLAFAAGEPSEAVRIGKHFNPDVKERICDQCHHYRGSCGPAGHRCAQDDAEFVDPPDQDGNHAGSSADECPSPSDVWCTCRSDGQDSCLLNRAPSPPYCRPLAEEYACVRCASPGRLDATGPDGYADSCPNCPDERARKRQRLEAVDPPDCTDGGPSHTD